MPRGASSWAGSEAWQPARRASWAACCSCQGRPMPDQSLAFNAITFARMVRRSPNFGAEVVRARVTTANSSPLADVGVSACWPSRPTRAVAGNPPRRSVRAPGETAPFLFFKRGDPYLTDSVRWQSRRQRMLRGGFLGRLGSAALAAAAAATGLLAPPAMSKAAKTAPRVSGWLYDCIGLSVGSRCGGERDGRGYRDCLRPKHDRDSTSCECR